MPFQHVSMPLQRIIAGYVRRSSEMQSDNYSRDAQIRSITQQCQSLGLPAPIIYEDDELSARGEQIAHRPAFKMLLEDVEAGKVQMVIVHSLDRWARNVMVTLQSFRILAEHQTAFLSLSEHIDYSTPEGRLQLTILAAFAAYFSDMLAKHTSKGKGERAAQGLPNGDIPFGYRWTGPKSPPEYDPDEFPGLRMIGELRMQGKTAEQIADAVNAAGYRTGSKRFGARLFTIDTINAITRCEFYAAFAPGDDRGTIVYKGQRFRGQHPAAFTFEEWQRIRTGTRLNYKAPHRSKQAQRIYEFSGYIVCVHCGLNLRCRGASGSAAYAYYKDMAKARQLPCPVGGYRQVRTDLVTQQFGALLQSLRLPPYWRDMVREKLLETAKKTGLDTASIEREKERLKLKRGRLLKQHRDGYIDDEELEGEVAAIDLALRNLEAPEADGVHLEDVIAAGERLPGMAALWNVATPEERREMVTLLLEPGGLHYDVERKEIAAITPRPTFLPVLRLLEGIIAYEEASGVLITSRWQ
ncbi:MAG TPA: recombinase family protein [Ktedonobacteraceae bacterium]|nr:recombinase family protein [Ktedonobacteraceae bacterium]